MSIDFTPETSSSHADGGEAGANKAPATRAGAGEVSGGQAPVRQTLLSGTDRSRRHSGVTLKLAGLVALLLSACAAAFAAFHYLSAAKPDSLNKSLPVMTITAEPVAFEDIVRRLSVSGSIAAWDPISIGSEVNGLRIESVLAEEGDHVKAGQVLSCLNSSVLKAQLDQQRAQLLASQANLTKAIQPNRIEDLNSLKAMVSQSKAAIAQEEANLMRARSNFANAQENARRYADLRKQGAVSQMETDNASTAARIAQAEVTNAEKHVEAARYSERQSEEHLSMALSGGRVEDILAARATVAETKARVSQLEAQVAQTVIRAPADGLIVKRDAHIGEITAVGKQLFMMVREDRLELRAQVPECDLTRIKPGQSVSMTAGNEGGGAIVGSVREISPLVDQSTRLGVVRIDVPHSPRILPGMFYHADIDVGNARALTVPSKAVLTAEDRSFVFVLAGDRAQSRSVKTGERIGDRVEIVSGLQAGDRVIVSGAGFLRDDDLVKVVR